MAKVKMIRTTHDKVNEETIPIVDGSYIVTLDTREIYLDGDEARNSLSLGRIDTYNMIHTYDFVPNQSYLAGDYVYYNGYWYSRKTNGSSETFSASDWDQLTFYTNENEGSNNIDIGYNFNIGHTSLTIGNYNYIVGTGDTTSVLIGTKNFLGFPGVSNTLLFGEKNKIVGNGGGGNYNIFVGSSNSIDSASGSAYNFIHGRDNTLSSTYIGGTTIFGNENSISPESASNYIFIEGNGNEIGYIYGAHIEGEAHKISSATSSSNRHIHFEGNKNSLPNTTSGNYCVHVEGHENTISGASNNNLHIEGYNNSFSGSGTQSSHIEGTNHVINGSGAGGVHIEGVAHTVSGGGATYGAHIEGSTNTVTGSLLSIHIEGENNSQLSSSPGCHVEGSHNTVYGGFASHCGGYSNTMGSYNSSTDDYSGSNISYATVTGANNIVNEHYETVIGNYNKPYPNRNGDTLLLIGNGTSQARSNIVEVTHSTVALNGATDLNGAINYYSQDLFAPIKKVMNWFSPPMSGNEVPTAALDPATSEYIKAIDPIIVESFADINTYLATANIEWIKTLSQSKRIHLYNPSTTFYFSFERCEEDIAETSGRVAADLFTIVRGDTNIKTKIMMGGVSTTDSSTDNNPLTSIALSYAGSNFGGVTYNTGTSGVYTITWMPVDISVFVDTDKTTFEGGEWWFWTTDASASSTPIWSEDKLNLDNIMEYGYAKALQTQYNINWIASTEENVVTYRVNSIVIYSNCIYRCIVENADEEWTPAHWEQIGITKAAFDALEARVAALEG